MNKLKGFLITCICFCLLTIGGLVFVVCGFDKTSQINFRVEGEYIQWTEDGKTWNNLVELNEIKGEQGLQGIQGIAGKQVEFQKTSTHIQWRYVGEISWKNLVALESIKGEDGEDYSVVTYDVALHFTTPSYWKSTALTWAFTFEDLIFNNGIVKNYDTYFMLEEGYTYTETNQVDSGKYHYQITSNTWIGDKILPDFKNTKFEDYFLGWFIEDTDVEITPYTIIGGDVSLEIKWDEENMRKYLYEGVTFGPSNETGICARIASAYPTSKLEPSFIIIPEYFHDSPVTEIKEIAYDKPENVLNVIIPNTITTIGEKAFYNCSKLGFYEAEFDIGSNIIQIGKSAFEGSGVDCVFIMGSSVEIGENAFKDSSIRKIFLPSGKISVGDNAFSGCSKLTTVGLENEDIANSITSSDVFGGLFANAETIYIKTGLVVSGSDYLRESFTKYLVSDKEGFDKFVKNV